MILDVYVDGSYSKRNPHITQGGVVVVRNGSVVSLRHVVTKNPNFVSANNAGGEVIAALTGIIDACQLCIGEKSILNIYYDYKGVRDFIKGTYVAQKEGMKQYVGAVNAVLNQNPNVELIFHKVKAHSGDKYNDLADSVAKGSIPIMYQRYAKDMITI